jgi:hypothetical protein
MKKIIYWGKITWKSEWNTSTSAIAKTEYWNAKTKYWNHQVRIVSRALNAGDLES